MNLNYDLKQHLKSDKYYQVMTAIIEKADGTVLNIPLVMPHLLDEEDIKTSKIKDIQISLPIDLPEDFSFGEIGDEEK